MQSFDKTLKYVITWTMHTVPDFSLWKTCRSVPIKSQKETDLALRLAYSCCLEVPLLYL